MLTAKWMLRTAAMAAAIPWLAHAEGLKADLDEVPWARWQARLALGATTPLWRGGIDSSDRGASTIGSASLMGDYYFARTMAAGGVANGFRATSGLIVGPRANLWTGRPGFGSSGTFSIDRRLLDSSSLAPGGSDYPASDVSTTPYLGIGYTGLSLRGGWSVSADLGLVALAPGNAVKLGRVVGGTQSLDELLRDLRLSPVIQLGVSYSF
jgi:hypothetical protein